MSKSRYASYQLFVHSEKKVTIYSGQTGQPIVEDTPRRILGAIRGIIKHRKCTVVFKILLKPPVPKPEVLPASS